MPEVASPEIVDIDAGAALDAARAGDATLHSLVEFDRHTFNTLYASEETQALYDSGAAMEAHFERIHDYVNIDFTEIELFTQDLFSVADAVRYKATALDVLTIVRVYADRQRGLFFAIESGDSVEPLVQRLESVVR